MYLKVHVMEIKYDKEELKKLLHLYTALIKIHLPILTVNYCICAKTEPPKQNHED